MIREGSAIHVRRCWLTRELTSVREVFANRENYPDGHTVRGSDFGRLAHIKSLEDQIELLTWILEPVEEPPAPAAKKRREKGE